MESTQLNKVRPASADNRFLVFWRTLLGNRAAVVGGIIFLILVLLSAFAPIFASYDPLEQSFTDALLEPNAQYYFGTDEQGRDLYSRVLYGGRYSLSIGVISVMIGCFIGVILGLFAGYYGGWLDMLVMRVMDVMLAFPSILLALALISVLGPALTSIMIAIGISSIPQYTRVVRSSILTARESDYVMAATTVGCRSLRIMVRHVLPNCLAPVLVLATTSTAAAVITGAALSFLGLGIQPPTPEWGALLSGARRYMRHAPWLMLYPGLAISLSVIAINLLGDGLRDALDPKLKR